MQQLMQAARYVISLQLRSISGLETSFAHERCSWQELTLQRVYLDQLAKLPLASSPRIVCSEHAHTGGVHLTTTDGYKPIAEQVAAGAAAVQAAGGLHFSSRVSIKLYSDDTDRVAAAAPIIAQWKEGVDVLLYNDHEDQGTWGEWEDVLTALGQHLKCKTVKFWTDWVDFKGAFAELPQLLPHVEGFECVGVPDEEVVEMCSTATRPFTLYICRFSVDLMEQVQEAMEEAGHDLVTFDILR